MAVTHLARLTFRLELSTIQGCFNRSLGYGLSLADRMRLCIMTGSTFSTVSARPSSDTNVPLSQKILSAIGPYDLLLGRVDQSRHRLRHDKVQQLDRSAQWRFSFRRKGEPVVRDLVQGESQRPDVRLDRVREPLNTFRLQATGSSWGSAR